MPERNKITQVKGQDAIYASFPYEGEEYDFLYINDISKVVIHPQEVEIMNKATCKKSIEEIIFNCKFDGETNIEFETLLNDKKVSSSNIEIQDFVDALCRSVYDNKSFEQDEFITTIKRDSIEKAVNNAFFKNCDLCNKQTYNCVGRIIDKNNEVVGLINNFETSFAADNSLELKFNDVVSYLPLKDIDVNKIEFPTGTCIFTIINYNILNSVEGTLRNYTIKATNCDYIFKEEDIVIETEKDIFDPDLFFDDRAKFLAKKENVYSFEESNQEIIDDMFDFDF